MKSEEKRMVMGISLWQYLEGVGAFCLLLEIGAYTFFVISKVSLLDYRCGAVCSLRLHLLNNFLILQLIPGTFLPLPFPSAPLFFFLIFQ